MKWSYVVTGVLGALFVLSDGWWPLLGVVLIVLGFFMTMALGDDGELQAYIVAACIVWVVVIFGGHNPSSRYESDGPEPTCVAGSCSD